MSNSEEELKQFADRLRREKATREAEAEEQAARDRGELHARERAATSESQAWLNRVRELVDLTGERVPYEKSTNVRDGPGFKLTVGKAYFLAVLHPDGWHVRTASPPDLHPITNLPTSLPDIRERLLVRMVKQGLRDLDEGRVEPAPDPFGPRKR